MSCQKKLQFWVVVRNVVHFCIKSVRMEYISEKLCTYKCHFTCFQLPAEWEKLHIISNI